MRLRALTSAFPVVTLAMALALIVTGCDKPAPTETPAPETTVVPAPAAEVESSSEQTMTASAERGKAYYTTCAGCHGLFGEGNYGMHGPNLTVLEGEYLVTQLRHFRDGTRGGTADFYGWPMNGRSNALPDELAVRDVVAFIETLPKVPSISKTQGNLIRGQEIYAQQCASCHGARAEGMPALNAPRLAGLDDWYQLQQLRNFRNDIRGVAEADTGGQQMKPFADALEDEDALGDVVAWIGTLTKQ